MTPRLQNWRLPSLGLAVAWVLLPALVLAADRPTKRLKPGEYNPNDKTVEMFEAIAEGQIGVRLVPKDSTETRMFIENKTDQPLNVELPEAFAGVPVLAQLDGVGALDGLGGGRTNRSSSRYGQSYGGGYGGYGGGGWGGMGGMWNVPPEQLEDAPPAMFNVAPEKTGRLVVTTVCLEHGKAEPRAAMKYEIVPVDSFTDKKAVYELCRMLGSGMIDQRAAQAAAWHLSNDMSWEELATKSIRHINGTREPYFTRREIQGGYQIATVAKRLAQQRQQQEERPDERRRVSPGERTELSAR